MNSYLVLFLATVQLTYGLDLASYKKDYVVQVGTPFKGALDLFANDVLGYLANHKDPCENYQIDWVMSKRMVTRARAVTVKLKSASLASDILRQQLETEVLNRTYHIVSAAPQKAESRLNRTSQVSAAPQKRESQLTEARQAHDGINNVDSNLKVVISQLSLLRKDDILYDVVSNLTVQPKVITPLTDIANQLISFAPNETLVADLKDLKTKLKDNCVSVFYIRMSDSYGPPPTRKEFTTLICPPSSSQ